MIPSPLSINRITQISVTVHDVDKAVSFYRDVLGLKLLFSTPNMAFFDCDGQRLMLGVPEKPEFDHPGSVLYFQVTDIVQAFELLTAHGVKTTGKPHIVTKMGNIEIWMAFFKDVDGNVLALTSEVPVQNSTEQ